MKFKKNSRGFTLIEVAIAIAIFGIALSSLIALQTRLVDNFIRERKLLRATLAAQYLMTFIEIESDPPGPQDNTTDLISELKKRGYFDDNIFDKLEEQYKGWKVNQKVTSVDFDQYQDVLRRVEIRISWGEGSRDSTSLIYFTNTNLTSAVKTN